MDEACFARGSGSDAFEMSKLTYIPIKPHSPDLTPITTIGSCVRKH